MTNPLETTLRLQIPVTLPMGIREFARQLEDIEAQIVFAFGDKASNIVYRNAPDENPCVQFDYLVSPESKPKRKRASRRQGDPKRPPGRPRADGKPAGSVPNPATDPATDPTTGTREDLSNTGFITPIRS